MNTKTLLKRLRKDQAEESWGPPVQMDFTAPSIERLNSPQSIALISRREQFLLMVFSGALMRDIRDNKNDAQLVARTALEIDEAKIPPQIHNAAASFLNYFYTNLGTPHKWMLIGVEREWQKGASSKVF